MTPIVINIFIYFNCSLFFFCYIVWETFISSPKLNISTVERKSPIALCKRFKRKIKKSELQKKIRDKSVQLSSLKIQPHPF